MSRIHMKRTTMSGTTQEIFVGWMNNYQFFWEGYKRGKNERKDAPCFWMRWTCKMNLQTFQSSKFAKFQPKYQLHDYYF